ncbi:biotin--[acetyl-CoA-carboxylase] ligase [Occallatibacter riparius]|uniref:Biotin--[acetyl-CoA-carboxylase] ligase n=1 Tax=Occallatibacter riparius TaxID=1002689 RepID=A0A9J7BW39_9BACT|nr:biotin--[acetyl-CoA-carboxylase] ligase [Occallatibacter riparius]UWZ86729.1 biotin--[acetyl-CoA-carboxylase] ligase [Occallatibacter riparius]
MYELVSLESALAGTVFAGKLHYLPSTGSTNSDAMTAARNGAPHGSVWFADEQTAGRGRGDHAWHSAVAQGLYVSVLLRLPIAPADMPLLPLAAGLAAADAVRAASGLSVDLRWPNDLLIGERKAGGILVESQAGFAVVGIGINVHQQSFAADLATPGTSLDLESGRWIDRQPLLIALLEALEREARGLLDAAAVRGIPERVARASTWVKGKEVEVHGPQECTGVTDGLDEHGFLIVRTATGVVQVQTGGIRVAATRNG